MARVQVLLADDEPFILKGLQMLIDWELYGCEIAGTASNGLEAYNIIKSKKIDLAIVDIRMPEMTGLELITQGQGGRRGRYGFCHPERFL